MLSELPAYEKRHLYLPVRLPKNLHDRCRDLAARRGFLDFDRVVSDALIAYLWRRIQNDFDALEKEKTNNRHPELIEATARLDTDSWRRLRLRAAFRSPDESAIVRRCMWYWEQ